MHRNTDFFLSLLLSFDEEVSAGSVARKQLNTEIVGFFLGGVVLVNSILWQLCSCRPKIYSVSAKKEHTCSFSSLEVLY